VRVTIAAPGILRIAIGDRPPGAASSYLPSYPLPVAAASVASLDGGFIVATHDVAALLFSTAAGRPLLRLDLATIALIPTLRLRFEFLGEQHFYGLGEGGPQFDRLGAARRLWNFQSNRGNGADIAIPLLLSQAGYALFFDNSAAARIEPADVYEGSWFDYAGEPGPLDLYLIGGADLRAVMGVVADLLGHAAMPPRWALGYMQSSRHFDGPEEVRALAHTLREKLLPCDVLIFLSTYGTERGLNRTVGDLRFQPDLFPDPAAVLGAFHDAHFHVLSHEYPVLHPASPGFAEAERLGYLLDYAYPDQPMQPGVAIYKQGQRFLDFSRPEVRCWWWRQHADLLAVDIDGWWLDGGEGPPAATALHAGSGAVLHNRFDLLRQQAFAEGEQVDRPDRRPFLLCRSGGPGMQRFGAMAWSGDINTSFATFEAQVRIGLNFALSGVPHWGTDIGGFYLVAPDQGELFVRWLQFGAFCSIFRAHGHVWRRHLPWAHGAEIEAICRRYIELRYQLMPYTYTLAWQAHRQGLPTMRPLVLNYPNDPAVWDLGTQGGFNRLSQHDLCWSAGETGH
jgi:alpha-glucosidase (family GH31 glycosyl hydrolase)